MEKTWYIKIRGKQKGPYTFEQLKRNKEITPDTLVWDAELKAWIPMRDVPELQEIFKEQLPEEEEEEETFSKKEKKLAPELVLEMQSPSPFIFWLLIAIAVVALVLLLKK